MTTFSPEYLAARERHRRADGRFGVHPRTAPEVPVAPPDLDADRDAFDEDQASADPVITLEPTYSWSGVVGGPGLGAPTEMRTAWCRRCQATIADERDHYDVKRMREELEENAGRHLREGQHETLKHPEPSEHQAFTAYRRQPEDGRVVTVQPGRRIIPRSVAQALKLAEPATVECTLCADQGRPARVWKQRGHRHLGLHQRGELAAGRHLLEAHPEAIEQDRA
ncbi:MAG: hypothetical protein ACTH0V_00495 [Microbacteriaceae bacterium]